MRTLGLAAFLIAYNNLLNRWGPFNGWPYTPMNFLLACALVLTGTSALDLSAEEQGLSGRPLGDVAFGAALGAALVSPLFLAARRPSAARFIADRRVEHLRGTGLAYQVLVRVPIGTALLEEVAFRGLLVAAATVEDLGPVWLVPNLAFGLWHVAPTMNMMEANRPDVSRVGLAAAVAATLVFTFCAGVALTWVRTRTGGIWAPIGLHAAVNSLGTMAAVVAGRRRRRPPGHIQPGS